MKTRADLLVRDALAENFVRAAAGSDEARETIAALRKWATGGSPDNAALSTLRMETGAPIFTPEAALCAELAALEPYIRDRAVRYAAALEWIVEEPARNDVLEHARAAWDAGLFFEVHELLEPVWLRAEGEDRPRLQGLIMAGAALHHLTRGNIAGARGLLRDAARRLTSGDAHPVLDLAAFGRELAELAERVAKGEITSAADLTEVPALRRR